MGRISGWGGGGATRHVEAPKDFKPLLHLGLRRQRERMALLRPGGDRAVQKMLESQRKLPLPEPRLRIRRDEQETALPTSPCVHTPVSYQCLPWVSQLEAKPCGGCRKEGSACRHRGAEEGGGWIRCIGLGGT